MTKFISIVTPTFNEELNIDKLLDKICDTMNEFKKKYDYEVIIIDNNSKDNTKKILKEKASCSS